MIFFIYNYILGRGFSIFSFQVEVGETVEFVHKPTGLLVSTTGILNGQDEGWLEVNDSKTMTMTMTMTIGKITADLRLFFQNFVALFRPWPFFDNLVKFIACFNPVIISITLCPQYKV